MGNRSSSSSSSQQQRGPVGDTIVSPDSVRPSRSLGVGEIPLCTECDEGDEDTVEVPPPMAPISQQLLASAKGGPDQTPSHTKRVRILNIMIMVAHSIRLVLGYAYLYL
jgi:hypothetical protein